MRQTAMRRRAAFTVHEHGVVDSTNLAVLRLARAGAPAGTVVCAAAQEAGRGRLGRAWHSPAGTGLYLSLLLEPQLPPARWGGLAIGAALALVWVLERDYGIRPAVKWPNDVLVAGRKLAGILIEGIGEGRFVLGIGINLQRPADWGRIAFRRTPTCLAEECSRAVDAAALRDALLAASGTVFAALEAGHGGLVADAVRKRLYGIGRPLRTREGAATLFGLGEDGALLVRGEDGSVRKVISGEVEYADRD